ncbi:Uncharacterized protein GBIM_09829 [Gryllus bimaculatus]|nr:Uncharacterized protein GBIM_09829 [Gryllus bimaculatus]
MGDEEARGKKKKIALLLPLALFFKIKALLIPILLGVLIIKKLLVVAAVLLPSLLGLVKVCKPAHHHGQAYTLHSTDWSSAAGSEYGPPAYGYPGHDGSRRHAHVAAYRAYAPTPGA